MSSALYDPRERGFPESFSAVDRAQIAMLRDLASADVRLVLKGGMAMRVVVGSMRLTKDVDFDRAADISTNAVTASVRKALTFGAQSARVLGARVEELKTTATTVRMRLLGNAAGLPVRFVVEVSGRTPPPEGSHRRFTVTSPARYGLAPFAIAAYTHDMLAATKVAAVMSPNRNVPRDIHDLHDLQAASPERLLGALFEPHVLQQWRDEALSKITAISFDQARDELLPYLMPDTRASVTPAAWGDMALGVAVRVDAWLAGASG